MNKIIIGLLSISTLCHSGVAFSQDEHGAVSSVASDRASFMSDSNKLHIPYVLMNEGTSPALSAEMYFSNIDDQGNLLFTLNPNEIHEIHEPHFGYIGEASPQHWGGLTTDYIMCGIGKNQSPIDIDSTVISNNFNNIEFNYDISSLTIVNNGHTIQVNYDEGSSIGINGKTYDLIQFHFHTPSEHTIAGESFPIEMHLVHISNEGDLAVIGVLFNEGAENQELIEIINAIPAEESEPETIGEISIDINNLLPEDNLEYRYSGSLTTPPCSEGVKWFVMQNHLEMSTTQLQSFQEVLGHNNRPVQPYFAREVLQNE